MNESGGPVKALATFYKIPPARIVAIHDELDIAFGTLRTKLGGGDNGHNGLRSLRSSLGTGDFYRVRAGIGRPPGRQDPADFVLSNYSAAERKELAFQVQTRPTRSSRCSPRVSSRPSSASTPETSPRLMIPGRSPTAVRLPRP